MTEEHDTRPRSLVREVGDGLIRETRTWARWTAGGAILGAVVVGSAGLMFVGLWGMLAGGAVGAVVGGVGAWWFYAQSTSLLP